MASQLPEPGRVPAYYTPRYVDIGINLSDPVFRGRYHGRQKHPDDLAGVVDRARQVGCTKLIVTGSCVQSSADALKLSEEYPETCYATAGIHPCSASVFGPPDINTAANHTATTTPPPCEADPSAPMPESHLPDPTASSRAIAQLTTLIATARSRLVALGELGLDYDRLNCCNAAIQRHAFAAQLHLAASLTPQLPLFLHSRAAHADFVRLLKAAFGPNLERLERGAVVHSFTGTLGEVAELMAMGLYIGINGCSLKTAANCDVVREVRLDRLMLETDGPWCEVRPSHQGFRYLLESQTQTQTQTQTQSGQDENAVPAAAEKKKNEKKEPLLPDRFRAVKKEKWEAGAMVKGRNEPCTIERVAAIVAAIKGVSIEQVCEAARRNTIRVFGLDETT